MGIKAFLLSFLCGIGLFAQDALHNYGALQLHDGSSVGFHLNLINDGDLNQDVGLVGFYAEDNSIRISGVKTPTFFDAEVAADNNLFLETPMGISNNLNLIAGNIVTPRNNTQVSTIFLDTSFYVGENDVSLVDGYAALTNKEEFTFPVGENGRLRPLTITSMAINPFVRCAYFDENPNMASTFAKSYGTTYKESEFLSISDREFWHLEGNMPLMVTLTWDQRSNISALGDYISDIKVVGWHKEQQQWVNLGNTDVQGSMVGGSITSEIFVPDEYEIITLGGNDDKMEEFSTIELDNYYMTPNGDGKNDYLVLKGIEKSPNNAIQIFNRYGVLVYSKKNYQNDFNGISNRSLVVSQSSGLASGIYFYIITLNDLRQKHQGYLYLSSKKK